MTWAACRRPPRRSSSADGLVGALVVVADANRLQRVAQLFLRRRVAGVEGFLIAPDFEEREVAGPSDLLEQLDADEAVLLRAGVAILLEERDGLRCGRGHRFDVGDRVEARVGRRSRSTCLLPGCCHEQQGAHEQVQPARHVVPACDRAATSSSRTRRRCCRRSSCPRSSCRSRGRCTWCLPTLKEISSPRSRPPVIAVEPSVPSTIWNVCFSVSAF